MDTLIELQRAAKELNELLGLQPEIELERGEEYLIGMIKEAKTLIVPEDVFSTDTQKVLDNCCGLKKEEKSDLGMISDEILKDVKKKHPLKPSDNEIPLSSFLDQLFLKGGTIEDIHAQIWRESQARGKKTYKAKYDVVWHMKERQKKGWKFLEKEGVYKLEKIL